MMSGIGTVPSTSGDPGRPDSAAICRLTSGSKSVLAAGLAVDRGLHIGRRAVDASREHLGEPGIVTADGQRHRRRVRRHRGELSRLVASIRHVGESAAVTAPEQATEVRFWKGEKLDVSRSSG